jgi:hypothetical protein
MDETIKKAMTNNTSFRTTAAISQPTVSAFITKEYVQPTDTKAKPTSVKPSTTTSQNTLARHVSWRVMIQPHPRGEEQEKYQNAGQQQSDANRASSIQRVWLIFVFVLQHEDVAVPQMTQRAPVCRTCVGPMEGKEPSPKVIYCRAWNSPCAHPLGLNYGASALILILLAQRQY